MSSERNDGAFRSRDVIRRQQEYTEFSRASLEAHMKGSIWLGSSDHFHEAPRKPDGLYSGMQETPIPHGNDADDCIYE